MDWRQVNDALKAEFGDVVGWQDDEYWEIYSGRYLKDGGYWYFKAPGSVCVWPIILTWKNGVMFSRKQIVVNHPSVVKYVIENQIKKIFFDTFDLTMIIK